MTGHRAIARIVAIVAVVAAFTAHAYASSGEAADAARMAPIERLVDDTFQGARGEQKAPTNPVILNDEARPVPLRAQIRGAKAQCEKEQPPSARCPVEIQHRGKSRLAILEPRAALPIETFEIIADHLKGPIPPPSVYVFRMPRKGKPGLRVPRYEGEAMRALLAYPMRKQWIESRTIQIPKGSELRFAIGVEEPAWHVNSAPVDFIVRAYVGDGKSAPVEIFRTTLDPARREEDRGWQEFNVPLKEIAGEPARLRFETLPARYRDRRPQLPVWGDPTIVAPASGASSRPYVVLVSLDTLRARSLSALGNELETSPFFDQLATQGTLFEKAFTTYSNTLGSHMSMLTGLWPRTHQVLMKNRLSSRHRTLAERLRKAGFETAAFTENALLNGGQGFRRGFGTYTENKEVMAGGGAARATFDQAIEWARSHRDSPFFLFVHTYQVHAPYRPAEPYASLYDDGAHRNDDLRRYEQEIRYLDDELRRLVGELDTIVGAENLLLVITADHGEEFGEHGFRLHTQLFDEVMHVPLLFRYPEHVPAGLRIDTPVSLVDITPTILELAGAEHFRTRDGVSLIPLFRENPSSVREVVFGEEAASGMNGLQQRFVGRSATHKCMVREKEEQGICWDLGEDPEEQKRLAPDSTDATRALHDALLAYRESGEPPDPEEAEVEVVTKEIDPKRSEKLRALGYVE